ncbi:MAG: hypothetical protein LBJ13_03360 [Puniceicoccales bacterium]|nr:hypothetical protein [Puniceicoccales bacterium]
MKTNTKIRLLVAALGGSVFSYSDVRASDGGSAHRLRFICAHHARGADEGPSDEGPPSYGEAHFPHWHQGLPPRLISSSASHDSLLLPTQLDGRLQRHPTVTGVLSELPGSGSRTAVQQERGLAQMIPILIKKHFFDALPDFIRLTVTGFEQALENGGVDECSLAEFFDLSLVDPDTFAYITRDQRPPRQSVAIYGYATDAIMRRDGIINRIKRNIIDEILMIIQLLITPDLPDEVIAQLENYIDHLLAQIVPPLNRAMFEVLQSEMAAEIATRCCFGWCRKLKKEDKQNLVRGILHVLGGVLGGIFGEVVTHGADEIATGICGIIAARGES